MFARFRELFLARKVDLYKEEIKKRNLHNLCGLSNIGLFICTVTLLLGLCFSEIVPFIFEFKVLFCFFAILCILSHTIIKKFWKYVMVLFYLAMTPLMLFGILMGTFLDPEVPSVTIMIFICVIPLLILDKPWRIVLYITASALVYSIVCFHAKDFGLFIKDMIDLVAFYLLAVGVNYFTLSERIDSVENYVKYREKSEKDLLTGLYNRGTGVNRIMNLIQRKVYGAFIIIDIDNFKCINDNYGHMSGDEVLQTISKTIRKCFDPEDIIFRMGGDEFAVYSIGLVDVEECKMRFDRVYEILKRYETSFSMEYPLSISMGCSIFTDSVQDFNQLYKKSDECLYEAKKCGKGCYRIR